MKLCTRRETAEAAPPIKIQVVVSNGDAIKRSQNIALVGGVDVGIGSVLYFFLKQLVLRLARRGEGDASNQ